jgi:hypothetical protein
MVTLLVASARFLPGGALGGRDFRGAVLMPVFTAFFGLRVIEVPSAARVACQFSGADPEARGRAASSRTRRLLKVIAVPLRNLAKWSVQLPGVGEPSPAYETVSVTSRWRGSHCVWWPFAVARAKARSRSNQARAARSARSHHYD